MKDGRGRNSKWKMQFLLENINIFAGRERNNKSVINHHWVPVDHLHWIKSRTLARRSFVENSTDEKKLHIWHFVTHMAISDLLGIVGVCK